MMNNTSTSIQQRLLLCRLSAFQVVGLIVLLALISKAFSFGSFDSSVLPISSRLDGSAIIALRRHQQRSSTSSTAMWAATAATTTDDNKDQVWVALTREDGKNDKMVKALNERNDSGGLSTIEIHAVEVPCIVHADGPDMGILADRLQEKCWDYVIITSPEAARVAASVWSAVKNNPPPVAAVGKATESALKAHGINVVFTPSKATAETLAIELPARASSGVTKVMYPASCKAQDTLQTGLTNRGFEVVRLNTYDTVTAEWTDQQKAIAAKCKVACFASPSSIKGWLKNTNDNTSIIAACIGTTSADACRKLGWKEEHIFYPEYPGIEGWVDAVQEAVGSLSLVHDS